MNDEEINLVNKTVELWNDFIKLPELYKNDRQYVQYHIDAIQAIIMQRQTARNMPILFKMPDSVSVAENEE